MIKYRKEIKMKKGFLLFLLLGIVKATYSEIISLDTMLEELNKTSYENKIYEIQGKINQDKEKYYKLDDYNGVTTDISSNYSNREDAFETTGRVQYGPVYFEGTRNYNSDDEAIIGVEKNIKELIYSNSKNQLKQLKYTKEVDRLNYKKRLEEQKIGLINLYKEYKSNELEIEVKKSAIEKLKVEEKKLAKSYSLGATPKIELDSIEYSIKNMELEIEVLKRNLEKLKRRFFYDFGISVGSRDLKEIVPPTREFSQFLEKYGEKDLQILGYEIEKSKEGIKYLSYNDYMPDITLGVEHSNKYDENRVILKFSKRILDFNMELENQKDILLQKELDIKQRKKENEGEKLSILNTYENYKKEYEVNKNNSELELAKYNIKKME